MLGIDTRDVPGLVKDAGRENLQVLQDDGTLAPIDDAKRAKSEPKSVSGPKPKPKVKAAEKQIEVDNGD